MADSSSWTISGDKVQYNVYLGTWVNWSRGGRILGATLTMDSRYGLLLLSFTATFVGFVASRFWRIATLILHRIYSTPQPRDALHHQRQVVLRNSLSAASTLWEVLQLTWCWWTVADGYLARTLPTIIFAASVFCVFIIASGFTSSISTGIGNDVLIDGSQCGMVVVQSATPAQLSVIYSWASQFTNNAANYAQQCYSSNATGTLDCTTFVKSRLQFSSVVNASCPFRDNICRSNDSNLSLDSGLISSDDLGLNMPSSQRIFYRQTLDCAPLRTDGFVSNMSTEYNNYTRYSYQAFDQYESQDRYNWTYEVENLDAQYRRQPDNRQRGANRSFKLAALLSHVANGTVLNDMSDFTPIPQLFVSDADLLLIFLSPGGVYYLNQTEDPWYRGIVPRDSFSFQRSGAHVTYAPDEAASPMGCLQRYQYCNSRKQCGKLASFQDAVSSASTLFHYRPAESWGNVDPSHAPDATMDRFRMFQFVLSNSLNLSDLLNTLGQYSLLGIQHFTGGFMGPLPENQWQLDVSHWFAACMASLQATFVNTAHGPTDEALLPFIIRPDSKYQREMCNNQKIHSTNYTSLSLFGLYFTYVTGILIILASYMAEPLLALFYSRRKYEEYKYLEWAANSTLQLQRLAYQGLGSAKWSNYTDDIPKTRPGYFLADLARAYPPGDDDKQVQGMKPTVHAISTTTPSVSGTSANLRVSEQSRGAPSRPVSAVSESAPQAVSPQAVSPISQHPQG